MYYCYNNVGNNILTKKVQKIKCFAVRVQKHVKYNWWIPKEWDSIKK